MCQSPDTADNYTRTNTDIKLCSLGIVPLSVMDNKAPKAVQHTHQSAKRIVHLSQFQKHTTIYRAFPCPLAQDI